MPLRRPSRGGSANESPLIQPFPHLNSPVTPQLAAGQLTGVVFFLPPFQRFSTDDGNVKSAVPANESEHALYQLHTAIISELAQRSIPEVFRLICVAAGTM